LHLSNIPHKLDRELDRFEINQMVYLDVFKFFKRYNEFLFKRILHHNEMM